MSNRKSVSLLSLYLIAAMLAVVPRSARPQAAAPAPAPAPAAERPAALETGCEERNFFDGYYTLEGRKTFDDERFAALAMRLNTPVYKDATGTAAGARPLRFSERVRIVDPGEGTDRLRIKDSSAQPLGWVARNSVLCRVTPIADRNETGLYKRVVVRTDTAVQGQIKPKTLYQTPAMLPDPQRCESTCAEVSRFQWYFIYAEENDHYLISESANLRGSTGSLMGWLPKGDGYIWNTALGLRPREELAGPNGDAAPGVSEKFACAYTTMEDLLAVKPPPACNQILGGRRWFGLNVRMAVLQETPRAYEVLFSNAGTAGRDTVSAAVGGLNRLDVFFVLDGTKSMQPAISAIKALTQRINEHMRSKISQGGVLRYGFRIYRDSNAKSHVDGVSNSEFLALPKVKCDVSNLSEFDAAFAKVKAFDPEEDDDFSENSFTGIAQASEDAAGCNTNAKLIFVIGDHGYDGVKQQSRGFTPLTEANVGARLRQQGQGGRFQTAPVVVFIQTPKESGIVNKVEYDRAYEAFEKQGRAILAAIYAGTKITRFNDYFINLPQNSAGAGTEAAIATTLARIDNAMNPEVIRLIGEGLNNGEPLEAIIERLRNNDKMNIPINFLMQVQESLCRQLGSQCRTQVLEAVNHAFVPVDDNVTVPEVLLSRDQIEKWLKILEVFKNNGSDMGGVRGRNQLIYNLLNGLSNVIQVDLPNDAVSLAKRVQFAAGLPNSARSRLMQYSDEELRDPNRPDCEIGNLKTYAAKKYDVLNIIFRSEGKKKPLFNETTWPDGACPNLSTKGKRVPNIDGVVREADINRPDQQTNYSMMHKRGNESFFWIPVNDLP